MGSSARCKTDGAPQSDCAAAWRRRRQTMYAVNLDGEIAHTPHTRARTHIHPHTPHSRIPRPHPHKQAGSGTESRMCGAASRMCSAELWVYSATPRMCGTEPERAIKVPGVQHRVPDVRTEPRMCSAVPRMCNPELRMCGPELRMCSAAPRTCGPELRMCSAVPRMCGAVPRMCRQSPGCTAQSPIVRAEPRMCAAEHPTTVRRAPQTYTQDGQTDAWCTIDALDATCMKTQQSTASPWCTDGTGHDGPPDGRTTYQTGEAARDARRTERRGRLSSGAALSPADGVRNEPARRDSTYPPHSPPTCTHSVHPHTLRVHAPHTRTHTNTREAGGRQQRRVTDVRRKVRTYSAESRMCDAKSGCAAQSGGCTA